MPLKAPPPVQSASTRFESGGVAGSITEMYEALTNCGPECKLFSHPGRLLYPFLVLRGRFYDASPWMLSTWIIFEFASRRPVTFTVLPSKACAREESSSL